MRNRLLPNYTFPLDIGIYPLDSANVSTTGAIFFGVICLPTNTWELLRTRWNMSVRSRSNWNLKVLVFKERGKPEYPEKNLSEKGREPTTNSTYIWRRRQDSKPRAALLGGERKLRLLKEQDEGLKNTCSSSRIHFLWLFLLVDELPNESVERNSQIFSNLIFLAIIWLCFRGFSGWLVPSRLSVSC